MSNFPKNILIILTHVSYYIPVELQDNLTDSMKSSNNRLLKNFSDFGTKFLISNKIPKNQIIEVGFSRALWDPNRSLESPDLFRTTDFNGIQIWKKELTKEKKEDLLEKYYKIHHNNVKRKILEMKKRYKQMLIIDLHDTWNLLMWVNTSQDKEKEKLFPKLALCDCEGETLNQYLENFIEKIFLDQLKIQPIWNNPYKSSFTISKYKNIENWIFALQIEFWRYLLIDEKTQTKNSESDKLKNWFYEFLLEIGDILK